MYISIIRMIIILARRTYIQLLSKDAFLQKMMLYVANHSQSMTPAPKCIENNIMIKKIPFK